MEPRKNKKLKIKLIEKDISQKEISRKTDIAENYLSSIINGRYLPSDEQKQKIAHALNCNPKDIFQE